MPKRLDTALHLTIENLMIGAPIGELMMALSRLSRGRHLNTMQRHCPGRWSDFLNSLQESAGIADYRVWVAPKRGARCPESPSPEQDESEAPHEASGSIRTEKDEMRTKDRRKQSRAPHASPREARAIQQLRDRLSGVGRRERLTHVVERLIAGEYEPMRISSRATALKRLKHQRDLGKVVRMREATDADRANGELFVDDPF